MWTEIWMSNALMKLAIKVHRACRLWKSEEQSGCWVWESRGQTHEILVPQSHSPAHQQRDCAESQTQKAWLLLQLCLNAFIQSGELSIICHTVLYLLSLSMQFFQLLMFWCWLRIMEYFVYPFLAKGTSWEECGDICQLVWSHQHQQASPIQDGFNFWWWEDGFLS